MDVPRPLPAVGEHHGVARRQVDRLAAILGPLVGTGLLAHFAPETAHPRVPGAPFFAAAAISAVGVALALRLFARSSTVSAVIPPAP